MQTVDGGWHLVQGASTPTNREDDLIAKNTVNNLSGYDEKDRLEITVGTTHWPDYYALTPSSYGDTQPPNHGRRYDSDDYLADMDDFFNLDYNEVFTKWSNPNTLKENGNHSNVGFMINSYNSSTKQFVLSVAVDETTMESFPPSKPQGLTVTVINNSAHVTWNANSEPDVLSGGKYKIYRAMTTGDNPTNWSHVATVNHPTTSWIDQDLYFTGSGSNKVFYSVSAVDSTNKESVRSEYDWLYFNNLLQKGQNTSTDEESITEYKMYNNYPNPFNPSTVIKYQLPETVNVTIKLYDMLGREVKEFINDTQEAGYYELNFDGSDLSSGTYIYRITAGDFTDSKKLLLVK